MSGTWYGVEIIDHVANNRPVVDSCIRINIRQHDNNYIELEWREYDFVVNYKFVILDQTRRGIWTSQGYQSGKIIKNNYLPTFRKFNGVNKKRIIINFVNFQLTRFPSYNFFTQFALGGGILVYNNLGLWNEM